ncbi:MAG: alpha/beta hydrolase, partial [Candidatus Omnitrophota bacterium]
MRYTLSLNRFDYINRGEVRTLVLIPGWASDSRIFGTLDLSYNYFVPENFSHFNFKESLLDAMEERGIKKISLFGWSLGGFLAQEFAMEYPDIIDRLILVSVRKGYKEEELSEIRKNLKRSKEGYLYKFYSQCFSSPH